MGASAAAAGVPVPGASVGDRDSSGTWRDPAAMFSGPNSVIDSNNHPSSVTLFYIIH